MPISCSRQVFSSPAISSSTSCARGLGEDRRPVRERPSAASWNPSLCCRRGYRTDGAQPRPAGAFTMHHGPCGRRCRAIHAGLAAPACSGGASRPDLRVVRGHDGTIGRPRSCIRRRNRRCFRLAGDLHGQPAVPGDRMGTAPPLPNPQQFRWRAAFQFSPETLRHRGHGAVLADACPVDCGEQIRRHATTSSSNRGGSR